jgi:hypothetical protein
MSYRGPAPALPRRAGAPSRGRCAGNYLGMVQRHPPHACKPAPCTPWPPLTHVRAPHFPAPFPNSFLIAPSLNVGPTARHPGSAQRATPMQQQAAFDGGGGVRVRKPYTITKAREKWTADEHARFVEAIRLHGRSWKKIEGAPAPLPLPPKAPGQPLGPRARGALGLRRTCSRACSAYICRLPYLCPAPPCAQPREHVGTKTAAPVHHYAPHQINPSPPPPHLNLQPPRAYRHQDCRPGPQPCPEVFQQNREEQGAGGTRGTRWAAARA